eukprot:scaffold1449_cov244-Pinguiococcus_pyrenoidosus.AAC.8
MGDDNKRNEKNKKDNRRTRKPGNGSDNHARPLGAVVCRALWCGAANACACVASSHTDRHEKRETKREEGAETQPHCYLVAQPKKRLAQVEEVEGRGAPVVLVEGDSAELLRRGQQHGAHESDDVREGERNHELLRSAFQHRHDERQGADGQAERDEEAEQPAADAVLPRNLVTAQSIADRI